MLFSGWKPDPGRIQGAGREFPCCHPSKNAEGVGILILYDRKRYL